MKYVPPTLTFFSFSGKENILLITASYDVTNPLEALWSDGFNKNQ